MKGRPKAIKSATKFEKDIEFAQAELERLATELGDQGRYIGEWHSHLVVDPEPSGQDVGSLTGIAEASNYATRCPVMLIAGFDKEKKEVEKLFKKFAIEQSVDSFRSIMPKVYGRHEYVMFKPTHKKRAKV